VDRVEDGAGVRGRRVQDVLQNGLGLVELRCAIRGDPGDGDTGERVEGGRVEVAGRRHVRIAHAVGPTLDARPVVRRVRVTEEASGRLHEACLAGRPDHGARPLRRLPTELQRLGSGSVRPERLEEARGHAPVRHGARRIRLRDFPEQSARLLVHHVVHERQRPIDTVQNGGRAVGAEVHDADLGAVTDQGPVVGGLRVGHAHRPNGDRQQQRGAAPRDGIDGVLRHVASSSRARWHRRGPAHRPISSLSHARHVEPGAAPRLDPRR
jgi:hypothetical protein